jgi:hypothetical protein
MTDRPFPGPTEILALDPDGADELFGRLERTVPVRPPLVRLPRGGPSTALVFGDSHGDWRSTEEVVARWRALPGPSLLIGLGDYIDRSPNDSPNGSVANALSLLGRCASAPDRVLLIQGNHESHRRIPVLPHTLAEEVDDLWGPDEERYHRLLALLERGPIAVTTPSGAYLAHAGFPRSAAGPDWPRLFEEVDDDRLAEVVWAECDASRNRRGAAEPWGARALDAFLGASGMSLMLRGHDPDVAGRPLYGGRVLTLHTTRIYERYGGVLVAAVPVNDPLRNVESIDVAHLATEGRSFPAP